MPRLATRDSTRSRAFTLVELLVVMAIILIIAGLTLPGLKGTFNGINLNGASDIVTGQLLFARQAAISRNVPVEVRIYKYDNGGGAAWNTIAVAISGFSTGRVDAASRSIDEWLETPHTLGGSVIMDPAMSSVAAPNGGATDSFSTIIQQATSTPPIASAANPLAPWTAVESTSAPSFLKGLTYVAFCFQPDGSTNLGSKYQADGSINYGAQAWCLSLRNANVPASTNKTIPAANYVAVILDPYNGRASTYRP